MNSQSRSGIQSEEAFPAGVFMPLEMLPVIEAGSASGLLVQIESKWMHQMQTASGGDRGPMLPVLLGISGAEARCERGIGMTEVQRHCRCSTVLDLVRGGSEARVAVRRRKTCKVHQSRSGTLHCWASSTGKTTLANPSLPTARPRPTRQGQGQQYGLRLRRPRSRAQHGQQCDAR